MQVKQMKLLMESWGQFLKQGNTLSDNTQVIMNHETSRFKPSTYQPDDFAKIETLSKNKISKYIGAGVFGIVFLLNNGHILKLFSSGVGKGADNDMARYESWHSKQFSGKGTVNMPAIYEFGKIKTASGDLYFVEMGEVLPLTMWLDLSGRFGGGFRDEMDIQEDIDIVKDYIRDTMDKQNQGRDEFIKNFDAHNFEPIVNRLKKVKLQKLNPPETISLMKAIVDVFINTEGANWLDALDIHVGNIGVSIQKPKNWMVFDA